MFTIRNANTSDSRSIQIIAEKTWWPTYSPILDEKQIRFMLDEIYDLKKLNEAISNGQEHFIILSDENGEQGFASYSKKNEDGSIYKLRKIYVLTENHGKGYGKALLDEVMERTTKLGAISLDLNVNRFNKAKEFYEKVGFKIIDEEDVPIGPYFMNDYVMRLDLR